MYYLSDIFSRGDNDKFCCVIRRADTFSDDSIFACKFWISSNCFWWANSNIMRTFYHTQSSYCTLTFYEFMTRIENIQHRLALIVCLRMRKYSLYFRSYMFYFLCYSMVERESMRASDDETFSVFFEGFPGFIYRASVRIWYGDDSYTIMFDNWIYNVWIWWNKYWYRMGKYLVASLISVTAWRSEDDDRWMHKNYNKNMTYLLWRLSIS